jgi:hypothetical protein
MLDEDYNVWLIEINSTPSFEYSTVKIKLKNFIKFYKIFI